MKILLTGAKGFIGSNVYNYLNKIDKYDVYGIGREHCDLTKIEEVKAYMNVIRPDVIIHLAANPLTKLNENDPNQIIHDNVIATQNLCHFAKPGCKFIFASSVIVYGNLQNASELDVTMPTSVYGATKIASEAIISAYSELRGIVPIFLRMCATVGPGLSHGILKDFITKAQAEGEDFEVFGNQPGSIKPFCHVEDICNIIESAMNDEPFPRILNVVPDDVLSVEDIAKIVLKELNSNKQIKWMGSTSTWKGDNPKITCNNALLNWTHPLKYSSKDAIIQAIQENI